MTNLVDHALNAARAEFAVFPLRPLSEDPAVEDWQEIATTDETEIRAWWARTPNFNIGIAMGGAGGVFAVAMTGPAGFEWWDNAGLERSKALVETPGSPVRTRMYFRSRDESPVLSHELVEGVSIEGEGGYSVAPGSITSLGTYRGTLDGIEPAQFDPAPALADDVGQRMLPATLALNLIPELTSTGDPFFELVTRDASGMSPMGLRSNRTRILREALRADLTLRQAASVAWWSTSGIPLRDSADGLSEIWAEAAATAAPTEEFNDDRSPTIPLLSDAERARSQTVEWWGSRYVEWAESLDDGSTPFHRLSPWVVLSSMFGGEAAIPRDGEAIPLSFASVSVGARSIVAERARSAVLTALQLPRDRRAVEAHLTVLAVDGVDQAVGWTDTKAGATIWVVDHERSECVPEWTEGQDDVAASTDLGAMPKRFAADLFDARDRVSAQLGPAPFRILMDQHALERHGEFKRRLSEVITDHARLLQFADLVRKCASLAALAEGASVIGLTHELIAIENAEEWLANLMWIGHRIA